MVENHQGGKSIKIATEKRIRMHIRIVAKEKVVPFFRLVKLWTAVFLISIIASELLTCSGGTEDKYNGGGGTDTTKTDSVSCEIDWMMDCYPDWLLFNKEMNEVYRVLVSTIDETTATYDDTLWCTIIDFSTDTITDEWFRYLRNHENSFLDAKTYLCGVSHIAWVRQIRLGSTDTTFVLGLTWRDSATTKEAMSSVAVNRIKEFANSHQFNTTRLSQITTAHELGAQFNLNEHDSLYPHECIMVSGIRYDIDFWGKKILVDTVFCDSLCLPILKTAEP